MKVQVKSLKAIFLSAKNNKKAGKLCMKLSSTSNIATPKRTNKGVYFSIIFLDFFLKPVYPNMVVKSFKFLVLRLLEDKFFPMSLSKPLPQAEGNYHFPPNRVFWKSVFHPAERGQGYGAEKTAKVKLVRVLVTSFDKFHHLCNRYIFFWFLFCCVII